MSQRLFNRGEAQMRGETAELPVLGWDIWQREPRKLLCTFATVSARMRQENICVPLYQWSALVAPDALTWRKAWDAEQ